MGSEILCDLKTYPLICAGHECTGLSCMLFSFFRRLAKPWVFALSTLVATLATICFRRASNWVS
jgi:hypothetical protein